MEYTYPTNISTVDFIISSLLDFFEIEIDSNYTNGIDLIDADIILINVDKNLTEEEKEKIRNIFYNLDIDFSQRRNIKYTTIFNFIKKTQNNTLLNTEKKISKEICEKIIKENDIDKLNYYFVTKNI